MKNRFENYINNQYQSQFIETPLDPNFMFNVQNARQEYYDKLQAGLLASNPQVNFLRPNDYDMGHLQEADQYRQDINSRIGKISDMMKKDDLSGATTELLGLKTDPTLLQKKQQLEYSYEQDKQYREYVDKNIKDPYYKSLALKYYEQNRLKDKPFEVGMSLNSPVITDKYDYQENINKVLAQVEANGIPLGNGKVAQRVLDENGKYVYQYMTEDGHLKELTTQEVYNALSGRLENDPQLQGHLSTMDLLGNGERDMLTQMLIAAAEGKSFSDMTIDRNYSSDQMGIARAKGEVASYGDVLWDPAAYTNNEYVANYTDNITLDKDGNFVTNKEFSPKYKTGTGAGAGGSKSIKETTDVNHPVYKIKDSFVKIQDDNGQDIIVPSSKVPSPMTSTPLTNEEALNVYNGYSEQMKSLSPIQIPLEKPIKVPIIPSYSQDEDVYIRKIGEDGSSSYEKKKWSSVKGELKDADIYETAAMSAMNPFKEIGIGKVYTVSSKQGEASAEYEIIMPDKRYNDTFIKHLKDAIYTTMSDVSKIGNETVVHNDEDDYDYHIDFNTYFTPDGKGTSIPIIRIYDNSGNLIMMPTKLETFMLKYSNQQLNPEDE